MAKTKSGFKYEISEKRLNNFELLDAFYQLEDDPLVLVKLPKLLLGEEQTKRLYDHLRDEDGIVPTDKMEQEIIEIIEESKKIKNS